MTKGTYTLNLKSELSVRFLSPHQITSNPSSFILKVKAAEITTSGQCRVTAVYCSAEGLSDQYDMGFTMRFPRALMIRDDLSIADCMSATGA